MTTNRRIAAALVLVAIYLGLPACAGTEGATENSSPFVHLFTAVSETASAPEIAAEPWVVRYTGVELNPVVFDEARFGLGDTLVVQMFDGDSVRVEVTSSEHVVGHRNIRAQVLDGGQGHLLLSLGRDTAVGSIRLAGRQHHYYLRHAGDIGRHVLIEVDPQREDVLPEAPPEEWP